MHLIILQKLLAKKKFDTFSKLNKQAMRLKPRVV